VKYLFLVPARYGSKRIPRKNIRKLGDKPLICWTLDLVKSLGADTDILVSTDSPEIAKIASNSGALAPWLRPFELSSDSASSADVAVHALNWYETEVSKIDGLVLLQPTSPFRSRATVEQGMSLFEKYSLRPVVAVCSHTSSSSQSFVRRGDFLYSFADLDSSISGIENTNVFVPNGSLYIISPEELRVRRSFASGEIVPLVMASNFETIDIDTPKDWELAEVVARRIFPKV
jgi:CMP-N,N'-diacetyllegionaminic acid synthase